jgi:hypothetical protein
VYGSGGRSLELERIAYQLVAVGEEGKDLTKLKSQGSRGIYRVRRWLRGLNPDRFASKCSLTSDVVSDAGEVNAYT